jgi:hypothetical protein
MRFADRVKNTRPRPNGEPAIDDLNLEKFFTNPELGDLNEPATIVDIFGRIMVWYLPDILHPSLLVGPVHPLFLFANVISRFTRIPSIRVLLNSGSH